MVEQAAIKSQMWFNPNRRDILTQQTVTISSDDLSVSGDDVAIKSGSLIQGLIKHSDGTLKVLEQHFSSVKLDDLEIDDQGRVLIKNNPNFKQAAEALMAVGGSKVGNNCAC